MYGMGFEWKPEAGTLPGRTEMRVLMAMHSLERAGADPVPLGSVYGFVGQRGYRSVSPQDPRPDWSPSESTVRKRLENLVERGHAVKVKPGHWALSDEGRTLAKRFLLWTS